METLNNKATSPGVVLHVEVSAPVVHLASEGQRMARGLHNPSTLENFLVLVMQVVLLLLKSTMVHYQQNTSSLRSGEVVIGAGKGICHPTTL